MNGYLKQSTASQVRTIGPFVDDTDFKTLEDALTIANTDVKIKKNGAASGNKNSGGATADGAGGLYHLTWDATDTNTVGELYFSVKVAGALVVFGSYTVLEEAVYDALFLAAAPGYGTAQTGDSFARLGAPAGASVSADIAVIEAQTDDIGAAGAGLTAIPTIAAVTTVTNLTNAATAGDLTATMKASVNTEVDTGIADARLDELLAADSDIDGAAPPTVGSVVHEFLTKTAGSFTYDQTTDSLEAIRDNMSAGAGDWTSTEKEHIRHRLGVDGTASAPTATPSLATEANVNARATPAQVATELATYDAPTFAELDARTDAIDAALVVIDDFLDTEVAAIKAKTDNLPADPADASDIAASFTTVNTKLDTVDDFLDTEVAAIKAKTDQLVFTIANQVDANTQSINDVTIIGNGQVGTEFGV